MNSIAERKFNSNTIKLIAIVAMTIDHITWAIYPGYPHEWFPLLLHLVGRITCPIMCYFIAEGFHYTRNINQYTARLFGFAIISHFCYIFSSSTFVGWQSFIPFYNGDLLNQTSVMWALAWGLVMLRIVNCPKIQSKCTQIVLILLICIISFPSDWSCVASLCVLAFGTNRGNPQKQAFWLIFYVAIYAVVYFYAIDRVYGLLQMGGVLAIPIIGRYNGQRGKNLKVNQILKWLFYIYYPLHLLVIGLLQWV